ncbi:protein GLUTAMINE DUMPER 2-like [Durio zibethinus]|uniref:Protein GLUTAMINE DUMPER 2-like n=1 Tax=Durio zibethinus TaxID=66656 RepID=A0A6P6A553_DURZI|nr:protein GLUTAMINE DUMPER 2-like [Durio zibethinus]
MRPASNSTTAATGAEFRHWNSPIPYLFGGIAAMLGLIAMALVILACSYKKAPSSSHGEAEEKPAKQQVTKQLEMEPKIVVIMAGDQNPTYLANPVSSTHQNEQF